MHDLPACLYSFLASGALSVNTSIIWTGVSSAWACGPSHSSSSSLTFWGSACMRDKTSWLLTFLTDLTPLLTTFLNPSFISVGLMFTQSTSSYNDSIGGHGGGWISMDGSTCSQQHWQWLAVSAGTGTGGGSMGMCTNKAMFVWATLDLSLPGGRVTHGWTWKSPSVDRVTLQLK